MRYLVCAQPKRMPNLSSGQAKNQDIIQMESMGYEQATQDTTKGLTEVFLGLVLQIPTFSSIYAQMTLMWEFQ